MLKGCFTAIVTPFKGTGIKSEIDYDAFKFLLDYQKDVSGIVVCGTTGESSTLSYEEHNKLIEFALEHYKNIVIAGTGSNSTWEALELTKHAHDAGAEYSMQVVPYYNKPNQEGLYKHFATIAEKVDIKIILYNIPSRTGVNLEPETIAKLSEEYSNIVAIKEASGKEEQWKKIRELCRKDFIILSGNDSDTFKLMKDYDAKGVVSVASNIIPKQMQEYVEYGLKGDFKKMEELHKYYEEFFKMLFIDTNPIPVKEAMNMLNLRAGGFRFPLTETSEEKRKKIREVLKKYGLLK